MRRTWLRGGSELQQPRLLSLTASPLLLFCFCALKTDAAVSSFKMEYQLREFFSLIEMATMPAQARLRPRDPVPPASRSPLPAPLAPLTQLHPPRHLRKPHEKTGREDKQCSRSRRWARISTPPRQRAARGRPGARRNGRQAPPPPPPSPPHPSSHGRPGRPQTEPEPASRRLPSRADGRWY